LKLDAALRPIAAMNLRDDRNACSLTNPAVGRGREKIEHVAGIETDGDRLVLLRRMAQLEMLGRLTGCLFGAEHRDRIGSNCADHRWQRSKQRDRQKCK
jgi:hypothetical protein